MYEAEILGTFLLQLRMNVLMWRILIFGRLPLKGFMKREELGY